MIIQHPSSRVVFSADVRDPPRYEPVTEEQWAIRAVQEGLFAAVQKYGAPRMLTWLRNMAALAGQGFEDPPPAGSLLDRVLSQVQGLERPATRCLADGAALVNHKCVQCGRDNR